MTPEQLERLVRSFERFVDAVELVSLAIASEEIDLEPGDMEFSRNNVVTNASGESKHKPWR